MPNNGVPTIRIQSCNPSPVNPGGRYVLYWMIGFRRTTSNFSLQRAVEWAVELRKPLVILEALRVGYAWASDRLHRFILDGMLENAARMGALRDSGVVYYPYVEREPNAGKGLLAALSQAACVVVTDDFPCYFLPRMVQKAADTLAVRLEKVDSNGLLPLRATDRVFPTAHAFRRFLQQHLEPHLSAFPQADPFARVSLPAAASLPTEVTRRWPPTPGERLGAKAALAELPIDHSVGVVDDAGGPTAASRRLESFLDQQLADYADHASQPDDDARSRLSPYLHFGHISPHEVFQRLMRHVGWSPKEISDTARGAREGWWNTTPSAESWLDQLITWRELGFNMTSHRDDYDRYESLPEWAQKTLEKHRADARPYVYSLEQFAQAATHDPLWNAAQRQLVREGRIHNYLRMLWGKKILEWSPTPRDALLMMIELNNRYALDGRDPNSYSGIFWCLGRYDRAWGPERPVVGTVRYMSSENTARKLRVKAYLARYAP